jgi:nucleoporin NUP42
MPHKHRPLTHSRYNVTAELIKIDLTTERPIWPLSSYGPGKNAPLQLMEGEIEQSPEEMRVRHYLAVAQGNPQESVRLIQNERFFTDH